MAKVIGSIMSASISDIAEQAKALSPAERVALAEVLLESVQVLADPEVEAAWEAELSRRVAEVESSAAILVPSEDVYAKARKLLK
jgi:putative addiction module component (TIGR02574 family)